MGPIPQAPVPMGPPPQQQVKTPAILMIVFAGLSIAWLLITAVMNLTGSVAMPGGDAMKNVPAGAAGAAMNLFLAALQGLIIFGSVKMMKLESRGLAMAASILSVIPLCSPCCVLGIPWGIWGLVVLSKPEVKAAFTS